MAQKKLEYVLLLEEEGLSVDELPIEIRKRINVLRPLIAKFNDKPSDKMKEAIIKNDVEIAEMIADYIEKDLPEKNEGNDDDDDNKSKNHNSSKNNRRRNDDDDDDDDSDDDENSNKNGNKKPVAAKPIQRSAEEIEAEKKAQKEAEEERKRKEAEEEQKRKDTEKKPITNFGTLDMEKKIIENCKSNNGFISEKDLVSIIGKSPDYPEQFVFSIKLKKVFMKSLYQLV